MSPQEYDQWMKTKVSYQANLKFGIGHAPSIKTLIDKIDTKLTRSVVRFFQKREQPQVF
jgi:hypothetical protein